ncbi:Reverse transcriptase (RNA-dependent DNA polymerase) [Popillia japonica]|uniref:Reverse transcriptase (RNA-dependent DNA polymerase) n=1 Tax=Popillia japonica TaxID=7064 RepID=A0AAW1IVN6_POPJA
MVFHEFAERNGMKRSGNDFCLYIGDDVWLLLWVDDIIVTGPNTAKIIEKLEKEFTTKNLGQLKNFLGMDVINKENMIYITQTTLIEKILKKFKMTDCKEALTPPKQH